MSEVEYVDSTLTLLELRQKYSVFIDQKVLFLLQASHSKKLLRTPETDKCKDSLQDKFTTTYIHILQHKICSLNYLTISRFVKAAISSTYCTYYNDHVAGHLAGWIIPLTTTVAAIVSMQMVFKDFKDKN